MAELVFATKIQECNKKPSEKTSFFNSETFSMIEIISGRPEGDVIHSQDIFQIEKIRMQVLLKVASLSCTVEHVDYLYHLEEYLDAIR